MRKLSGTLNFLFAGMMAASISFTACQKEEQKLTETAAASQQMDRAKVEKIFTGESAPLTSDQQYLDWKKAYQSMNQAEFNYYLDLKTQEGKESGIKAGYTPAQLEEYLKSYRQYMNRLNENAVKLHGVSYNKLAEAGRKRLANTTLLETDFLNKSNELLALSVGKESSPNGRLSGQCLVQVYNRGTTTGTAAVNCNIIRQDRDNEDIPWYSVDICDLELEFTGYQLTKHRGTMVRAQELLGANKAARYAVSGSTHYTLLQLGRGATLSKYWGWQITDGTMRSEIKMGR